MRRVALGGTLAIVAGVAVLVAAGSRTEAAAPQQATAPATPVAVPWPDEGTLKGPKQPIYFRHDVHATQYQIQCQYCHYSVAVASEPGIPSMQTCMGCHLVIGGSDTTSKVEIKKLRDAWNAKQPVEWVRVHYLARHAHFPHQRHVAKLGPNACATCHGEVQRMPQVFQANNIRNMGWCISCHLERGVSRDCTVCHY